MIALLYLFLPRTQEQNPCRKLPVHKQRVLDEQEDPLSGDWIQRIGTSGG
jgi:hypothetical protein